MGRYLEPSPMQTLEAPWSEKRSIFGMTAIFCATYDVYGIWGSQKTTVDLNFTFSYNSSVWRNQLKTEKTANSVFLLITV